MSLCTNMVPSTSSVGRARLGCSSQAWLDGCHHSSREVTTHSSRRALLATFSAVVEAALHPTAPARARGPREEIDAACKRFKAGDVAGSVAFFDRYAAQTQFQGGLYMAGRML